MKNYAANAALTRMIKVALLTRGESMTRGEIWGLINASRPCWKYTNGEISDALRKLEGLGQISLAGGEWADSPEREVTLVDPSSAQAV